MIYVFDPDIFRVLNFDIDNINKFLFSRKRHVRTYGKEPVIVIDCVFGIHATYHINIEKTQYPYLTMFLDAIGKECMTEYPFFLLSLIRNTDIVLDMLNSLDMQCMYMLKQANIEYKSIEEFGYATCQVISERIDEEIYTHELIYPKTNEYKTQNQERHNRVELAQLFRELN